MKNKKERLREIEIGSASGLTHEKVKNRIRCLREIREKKKKGKRFGM